MSRRDDPTAGIRDALDRAARELPPGPAVDRLRNYCGRIWEVLRTPAFARSCSQAARPSGGCGITGANSAAEACFAVIDSLLADGVLAGEIPPIAQGAVARLLVSSLVARAHWCAVAGSIDGRVAGDGSRVVVETLDVLVPAIMVASCGGWPDANGSARFGIGDQQTSGRLIASTFLRNR